MSISVISNFPSGGGNNLKPKILSARYKEIEINTSLYWYNVAYGNGVFVAIGPEYVDGSQKTTNKYIYSYDGENWTEGALSANGYYYCVCFIKDRFYILNNVAGNNYVSKDGIHWTTYHPNIVGSGTVSAVQKIAYGNGVFVAVGTSTSSKGYIAYSYDITKEWNIVSIPIKEQVLNDIVYGNGMFIATVQNTNQYLYSYDGKRWYEGTLDIESTYINRSYVTYGNGKFVINVQITTDVSVETQENICFVSEDGLTWKKITLYSTTYGSNNTPIRFTYINYINGMFFITSNAWYYTYSYDGENWKTSECYYGVSRTNTVFGNGKFVNFRNSSSDTNMNKVYVLDVSVPPKDAVYLGNASDNDKLLNEYSTSIKSGYGTSGNIERIKPQLSKWKTMDINTITGGKSWSGVAYGNGIYVAIHYGESTDTYSYSYDGFQWESGTFTTAKKRTAIVFGNGRFVIFGDNKFEYSYDGIKWTIATFPETYPVSYCCYGNGIFIVGISNFTSFYYSYSGTSGWKKIDLHTSGYVQASYGENRFIVCNRDSNDVAILTDNIIDDVRNVNYILSPLIGTVSNYNNIIYGNGMFIAVSFEDTDIYNYSTDGGTYWNQGKFPFAFKAVSICYGNGVFLVTIENSKTYLYSYDGLEWESGELEELYSYSKILFLNDMFMICNNSHIHDSYGSYSKYQFATISKAPQTEKFLGRASEDDILEGASSTSIEGYNITGKAKRIYSGTVISEEITENFRSIVNATDIVYDDIQQKLFVYVCDNVLENNAAGTNSWKSVSSGTLNLPSIALTYLNGAYRLINNYVAYHNGKYIIIRSQSSVFKSKNGTYWTSIKVSPSTAYVRMVRWLHDRFVIIARSVFYYSTDGETFTESNRSSLKNSNGDWVDVAYGNGVYVAIFYQTDNSNATIAYSTDNCATWTQKSLSSTVKLRCIAYGLGMFVAIPETGQNYYTSTNGIDWTNRSSLPSTSSSIQNNYIAFISSAESSTIGNMFIIVKGQEDDINSYNPTSTYYTSTDGINWTSRNFPISGQCNNIRLCGSKLYALFYRSNVICSSSNGTNWNTQNLNTFERISSVAYGNGKLLALTRFGGISTSTDGGNSWNVSKLPWFNCFAIYNRVIVFGNGIFSVIGDYTNSGNPSNCSFWTEDGVNFTKISGNYRMSRNYFLNGMFFYTFTGIDFKYSTDGKTIQNNKFPANFNVSTSRILMAYGNGRYVAISTDMKKIAYSADGIVWMVPNALPIAANSVNIGNVAYGNLVFVACLNDKELLYSINGIGWSIRENTTGSNRAILFLNGVFFNGTHYSTNGIDWIPQRYPSILTSNNLYTIMGNNIIYHSSTNLFKNTFTLPPSDAKYLGDAKENDIIEGHSATSVNGYGIEGKAEKGMPYPIGVEDITGNIEYTACDWADVAYGNGIYIAVAKTIGTLFTSKSTNGTTWNAIGKNTNLICSHICFGNGKFVVYTTNSTGTIYTTTDGEKWTGIKIPKNYTANGTVKYINNKFVLAGDTVIYYSDDGENWTQSSMAGLEAINYWRDIIYANGKYIMVCTRGSAYTIIATSTDLENWTQKSIGSGYTLQKIEYGNGKFVIMTNTTAIIYSTDGENWTISANALDTNISPQTICYGNNLFIIAGGNSNRNTDIYYTSTDGISWTKRNFGVNGLYYSIKYLNNKYYAVSSGSTKILVSSNGISWSSYLLKNRILTMQEIAYGNGILLVQGRFNDYFRSTDMGKTWTRYEFATYFLNTKSTLCKRLVYGNGVFSLVYDNTHKYYSRDGITFTKITSTVNSILSVQFYNNLFFYFYNGKVSYYYTSSDGITITQRTAPFDINTEDNICYGNGKYVLWKNNGTNAAYSTDGINWTLITLPTFTAGTSINIYNVTYGNGLFIGIANRNDMIISTDGINWSVIKNPIDNFGAIDFINGIFVYGSTFYSYNGFDWIRTNLNYTDYSKSTKIGENYLSLNKGSYTVIIKAPPKDAYYLGDARPEDIPKGITFSSIHGYGLIGTKE